MSAANPHSSPWQATSSSGAIGGEAASIAEFPRPRQSLARAWLRAARVRQWVKNLLVLAAPAAAGALGHPHVLARVCVAFAVFCLLASGVYLINDARDAPEDRHHPVKRHRPVAAGAISPLQAVAAGGAMMVLGLSVSAIEGIDLLAVACGYVLLNLTYTTLWRRVPVADIVAIAGAFVLRALGGGVAAQVSISSSFLVVVTFAALFVAAGKRYSDFLDPSSRRSRRVLERYSAGFLRLVISVTCAGALAAYVLWAFTVSRTGVELWRELTIIPFALALLRYGLLVNAGRAAAPESVIFSDRLVMSASLAWLITFALGV